MEPWGTQDPTTSANCCGDDSGEYYVDTDRMSLPGVWVDQNVACCDQPTDCKIWGTTRCSNQGRIPGNLHILCDGSNNNIYICREEMECEPKAGKRCESTTAGWEGVDPVGSCILSS
jgi:hypothetical protein